MTNNYQERGQPSTKGTKPTCPFSLMRVNGLTIEEAIHLQIKQKVCFRQGILQEFQALGPQAIAIPASKRRRQAPQYGNFKVKEGGTARFHALCCRRFEIRNQGSLRVVRCEGIQDEL